MTSLLQRGIGERPPIDDRGEPIQRLNLRDMRRSVGVVGRAPLGKSLKEIIKTRVRGFHPVQPFVSLFCVAGLVISAVIVRPGMPGFFWLAVLWGALEALLGRWLTRRFMARDIARTVVAHALCGGCAYSLQDIRAQADGCILCPECGAAWAAERLTRAHWLPEKAALFAPRKWWMWLMLASRGIGTDARGVIHRRLDTRLRGVERRVRDARPAQEWRALRRDLRRIGRWWRAALAAPVIVLAAVCVRALALEAAGASGGRDAAFMVFLAIAAAALAGLGAAIYLGDWCQWWRAAVAAFVGRGACPVCGARTEARVTRWGEQRCCDGCGCAWRAVGPEAGAEM